MLGKAQNQLLFLVTAGKNEFLIGGLVPGRVLDVVNVEKTCSNVSGKVNLGKGENLHHSLVRKSKPLTRGGARMHSMGVSSLNSSWR